MDKRYDKRARRIWGKPQRGNTHRTPQKSTKKDIKLENAKTWWNTWILVYEIHPHSRQTNTRNEQMPSRCKSTWLDDQREDNINPKGPK